MPTLIQKKADGSPVRQWDLTKSCTSVGRGEQADIQVHDSEMSRLHFVIVLQGGSYVLQDQNSTNGTLVNGQRVTETVLKPNDRIQAGQTHFSFVEGLGTVVQRLEAEGRHYDTFVQKLSERPGA